MQMVEIGPQGVRIKCPHCRAELQRVYADRREERQPMHRITCYREIGEHARPDHGWDFTLSLVACPSCSGNLLDLDMEFIEPDHYPKALHVYSPKTVSPRSYGVASQSGRDWIMTQIETPHGPIERHSFEAMKDDADAWDWPALKLPDLESGPWDYARHFVLNRWCGIKRPPGRYARTAVPLADDELVPF